MTWSFDDNLPIYLQIIRILKYELARGKYQPGEKLPAVRELDHHRPGRQAGGGAGGKLERGRKRPGVDGNAAQRGEMAQRRRSVRL